MATPGGELPATADFARLHLTAVAVLDLDRSKSGAAVRTQCGGFWSISIQSRLPVGDGARTHDLERYCRPCGGLAGHGLASASQQPAGRPADARAGAVVARLARLRLRPRRCESPG